VRLHFGGFVQSFLYFSAWESHSMLSINVAALIVLRGRLVVFLVLTRIYFKPILRILDERAGRIARTSRGLGLRSPMIRISAGSRKGSKSQGPAKYPALGRDRGPKERRLVREVQG